MTKAIAHDEAERLREALAEVLPEIRTLNASGPVRQAFLRVIDVLETSPDAVVLPSDTTVSTQEAADFLGISRMTVVRLIDRGELAAEAGGVHRRISASELERYSEARSARRRSAVDSLAQDISAETPPDEVIRTR